MSYTGVVRNHEGLLIVGRRGEPTGMTRSSWDTAESTVMSVMVFGLHGAVQSRDS